MRALPMPPPAQNASAPGAAGAGAVKKSRPLTVGAGARADCTGSCAAGPLSSNKPRTSAVVDPPAAGGAGAGAAAARACTGAVAGAGAADLATGAGAGARATGATAGAEAGAADCVDELLETLLALPPDTAEIRDTFSSVRPLKAGTGSSAFCKSNQTDEGKERGQPSHNAVVAERCKNMNAATNSPSSLASTHRTSCHMLPWPGKYTSLAEGKRP